MIENKRNEESQEPCSQNTDQVSTTPVNVRLEIDSRSTWNHGDRFSPFPLDPMLRDTSKKSKQRG